MRRKWIVVLLAGVVLLATPVLAQRPTYTSKGKARAGSARAPFLLKAYSRMVTLDVVVENKQGQHIRGLKASDFQVYEQTPYESKKKYLQKIADLSEIHTAALRPPVEAATETTPGVYSNVVHVQKDPVPPTVLVVDAINTQVRYQAQVHVQMLKMLRQIPPNIPVAVFLMGDRLRLLQGFTTDHARLQNALAKAESPTGQNLGHLNPADDPNAAGNQFGGLGAGATGDLAVNIAGAKSFDQMVYAANIRERIDRTYEAFLSIARSLAGYPGRKNVLWLSTSFPLTLNSVMQPSVMAQEDLAHLDFQGKMQVLDNALSNAKIAVYPVDIGGVRGLRVFTAEVGRETPQSIMGGESRQTDMWYQEQSTMLEIAQATGGKVCMGNNRLANCIAKAVHDSSDYYEISYYPNSGYWNGEYRRIFVTVNEPGARLSYRRGYYATPPMSPDTNTQAAAMQEDCGDQLNATGIAFTAQAMRPDAMGRPVFRLAIDPSNLTFTPTGNGEQWLNVEVGVCTFNQRGWTQTLMAYPLNVGMKEGAYQALLTGGYVLDSIYLPGKRPSAVRVIVKDVPSGKMGSVYIQMAKYNQVAP